MDFSKLDQNEKLATYGSVAVVVGLIVASAGFFGFGLGSLALLAAVAMLAVVFLPQLSPNTGLPGSKGSLMLICGGVAAAVLVLSFLTFLGALGFYLGTLNGIFFLVALAGSLLMAWVGWQEFQAEGGQFRLGSGSGSSAAPTSTPESRAEPAPPPAEPAEPAAPPAEPAAPPRPAEPPAEPARPAEPAASDEAPAEDRDRTF